jgi:H+/gluconate symporter-like permease
MKDVLVYFSNIKLWGPELPHEGEFNLDYKVGLKLFLALVAIFLIISIGSPFITYTDYKASGKIIDLIGCSLFFLFFGLTVLLFLFGISYFALREETEKVFKKGLFTIKCPYCKKRVSPK